MSRSVAVIIPTLNEEAVVAGAIRSALAAGAAEVIVSDGGSTDGTSEVARREGAAVHACDNLRGRQMNCAATRTDAEILVFLHADTRLPADAMGPIREAIDSGFIFGGFRIEFIEGGARLRVAAAMINLRAALTRCPWGDQAQFIERERFLSEGGFREYPIMEDYEMAARMKMRGPTIVLPPKVASSGRRFLDKGVFRTAIINWRIIFAYHAGADPVALARMYRGTGQR